MANAAVTPADMKVFLNHIYEFKKGVRQMVLYTVNRRFETYAATRLSNQKIAYLIQPVDGCKINIFFGRKECIDAIRCIVNKPLNQLSPEEDFIIGVLLGYDLCEECERFCRLKTKKLVTSA